MPRVILRPEQREALAKQRAAQVASEDDVERDLDHARTHDLQLAERLRQIRADAVARRGLDAEQAATEAQDAAASAWNDIAASVTTPRMHDMLRDVFDRRVEVLRHELDAHVGRERTAARRNNAAQLRVLAQQDAIDAETSLGFDTNLKTVLDAIDRTAELDGIDPAEAEASKLRATSTIHAGRIARLLGSGRLKDALAWRAVHQHALSASDGLSVQGLLAKLLAGQESAAPGELLGPELRDLLGREFGNLPLPGAGSQFGSAHPIIPVSQSHDALMGQDPATDGIIVDGGKRAEQLNSILESLPEDKRDEYMELEGWIEQLANPEDARARTDGAIGAPAADDPVYSMENLNLGVNAQYAEDIAAAARRTGWAPQTIAAIIGAEAATRNGVWDPRSASRTSSARGMTQFLSGTWITEGERQGSYLNERARELGYLDANGRIAGAHRDAFLRLRFNSRDSIVAAAEYAQHNIEGLRRQGLVEDESAPALARYAYIAHHDGLTGAANFLRGTPQVSQEVFEANITRPEDRRAYLARHGNDRNAAYVDFMTSYIDRRIDVRRYMRNAEGVEVRPTRQLIRRR